MNFYNQNVMENIKKEYLDINCHPNSNIGVTVGLPDELNFFEWRVTMMGPKDSSYNGGIFILSVKFPQDYPNHGPEVCFKTPIYHVNVNPKKNYSSDGEPLGHVCISTLNWWKPEYRMNEVLINIFGLFYSANPDSPYGIERAHEFKNERALYEEKVKYFTQKYANPMNCIIDKEYNDSWDFSYP